MMHCKHWLLVSLLVAGCQDSAGIDQPDIDSDLDGLTDNTERSIGTDPYDQDSDNDGLSDGDELALSLDPLNPDSDRDGLFDGVEVARGTDPRVADSDGDGINDGLEVAQGHDPNDAADPPTEDLPDTPDPTAIDSDDDGLDDEAEAFWGTDPNHWDTDGDELADLDEVLEYGSDPLSEDGDNDGLTDPQEVSSWRVGETEFSIGTDPMNADTDFDGLDDRQEVEDLGSDPLSADGDQDGLTDVFEAARGTSPIAADTDKDGLSDATEVFETFTDPLRGDTDGDGIDDAIELAEGTDPRSADSDGDGLGDAEEAAVDADPLIFDTDSDGINDGDEVAQKTSPALADTDRDGLDDGAEALHGSDPLVADTDGDGLADGQEVNGQFPSDPTEADTDGDGLGDAIEVNVLGTSPGTAHSDADGWNDKLELELGLDPTIDDSALDADGDGLTNEEELDPDGDGVINEDRTDPTQADSDGDQIPDQVEVVQGLDPLDPDQDDDGLVDGVERAAGGDPTSADADQDGIADQDEPLGLQDIDNDGLPGVEDTDADNDEIPDADEENPLEDTDGDGFANVVDADSDNDGIPDKAELDLGLSPLQAADGAADNDGDGVDNRTEYARGTDHLDADSDDDGLLDGLEMALGLNPLLAADALADADNDGLSNKQELLELGTHMLLSDTDGDGLSDGEEVAILSADGALTEADLGYLLNPDADGDGVLDGDEIRPEEDTDSDGLINMLDADSDNDGASDGDEKALGTNPVRLETSAATLCDPSAGCVSADGDNDGDGIDNLGELEGTSCGGLPSSPVLADTDGDGIPDGIECALGLNPTRIDSDQDGLPDGAEMAVDGASYTFVTDPGDPDTDGDQVPDGVDPDPLSEDSDADGVPDTEELVDGWNAVILENPVPLDGGSLSIPIPTGPTAAPFDWYVLAIEAETTGESDAVELVRTVDGHPLPLAALRAEGSRWVTSRPLRPASDTVELTLETVSREPILVGQVVLMGLPAACTSNEPIICGPPRASLKTLALSADSDNDGLSDLQERLHGGIWIEVEQLDHNEGFPFEGAASGVYSKLWGNMTVSLGQHPWGLGSHQLMEQTWSVFVRKQNTKNGCSYVFVDTDPVACEFDDRCPGGDCIGGFCDGNAVYQMADSDRFEWTYGGTFVVPAGSRFDVTVQSLGCAETWYADKLLLVPLGFKPSTFDYTFDGLVVPPELLVHLMHPASDSVEDVYRLVEALPWGITDPMNADTDLDGLRADDHTVAGSTGWLTDGHEVALRMNPFDIDSDLDAKLTDEQGLAEFIDGKTRQVLTTGWKVAVGLTDAYDTTPRPVDADYDGIIDEVEIVAELCAVTDCSLIPPEDRNEATLRALTGCVDRRYTQDEVLCWFGDDDRDDDGIMDGQEDKNRNGVFDPEQGETDPSNPDSDGDCIPDSVELGFVCPQARHTDLIAKDGSVDYLAGCSLATTFTSRHASLVDLCQPTVDGNPDHVPPGYCTIPYPSGWTTGNGFRPDADPSSVTNPQRVDSDGDGLRDGKTGSQAAHDLVAGPWCGFSGVLPGEDLSCNGAFETGESDPSRADTDGDLLNDGDEVICGSCRAAGVDDCVDGSLEPTDWDGDGLPDGHEVNIHESNPKASDTDLDALNDYDEVHGVLGPMTRPGVWDTDGDGLGDGDELLVEGGPLSACQWREVCGVTGPCHGDGACRFGKTNPTRADTDGDGISDGAEVLQAAGSRTNPNRHDTDGDGLSDYEELFQKGLLDGKGVGPTDPLDPDSDNDGFLDETELVSGSNPNVATSIPTELVITEGGVTLDPVGDTDGSPWTRVSCVANPGHADCAGKPTGVDVITTVVPIGGRLKLGCQGQPDTAELRPTDSPATVTIVRNDVSLDIETTGAIWVYGPGDDNFEVWRGSTHITPEKVAIPEGAVEVNSPITLSDGDVVLDFARPACWSDADCPDTLCPPGETAPCQVECVGAGATEGRCAGTDAPDFLDLCQGAIVDTSGTVTLATDDTPVILRPDVTTWTPRTEAVGLKNSTVVQDYSSDDLVKAGTTCTFDEDCLSGECDFTSNQCVPKDAAQPAPGTCWKPPTPQRLRYFWEGDRKLTTPTGDVDPELSGPGTFSASPAVECPGGKCPDPDANLPRTKMGKPSADWKWNPPAQIGFMDFDNPYAMALGLFGERGQIQFKKGRCEYDLVAHRYTCIVNYTKYYKGTKKLKYKLDARMDYDIRGVLDFETVSWHTFDPETFPGVADGNGVALQFSELPDYDGFDCGAYLEGNPSIAADHTICDNGELKMRGRLTFPIPKAPLIEAIVDGTMVADHSPSSNGGLFMGMFGTLSFNFKDQRINGNGFVSNVPTRWQVGESTMAMLYDSASEPVAIVGATTQGIRIADQMDPGDVPVDFTKFFQPEPSQVNFCYHIESGKLQTAVRANLIGYKVDLVLQLNLPGESETAGELDWSQGGLSAVGRLTLPPPFKLPGFDETERVKLIGHIGFDGQFLFKGTIDGHIPVPGFAPFSLGGPSFEMALSNNGVDVHGDLQLPGGLGELTADGSITAKGDVDMQLSGEISPFGFELANVSGTITSHDGVKLTGKMQVPILPDALTMTGTIRDADDWKFTGEAQLTLPLGDGTKLAGLKATLSPSGLEITGKLRIPGLADIDVVGDVAKTADGGLLTLHGGLNLGTGKQKLAGGNVTLTVACADGADPSACEVAITASGTIGLAGYTIANTKITISTNGDIEATGNAGFAGLNFGNARIWKKGGSFGASGSRSVSGSVSELSISGTASIGFDGKKVYAKLATKVAGKSISVDIDSSGCVKVKAEVEVKVKVKLGFSWGWKWKLKLKTLTICLN